MVVGVVMARGGFTRKVGTTAPGWGSGAEILRGGSPTLCTGTTSLLWTCSIQNVADIWAALALGLAAC